jgi:leucyl/phenylalanyl-tRNA--protein transferase
MTFVVPDVDVSRWGEPQPLPPCRWEFPDPRLAGRDGLVGFGADLEPATLIAAYRRGIFPWPSALSSGAVPWFSPDPRAVIPLDGLHVSRTLARTIRRGRFRLTADRDFCGVIAGCADRGEDETWITPAMQAAYARLNDLGWAHSIEAWDGDGRLAGGLYGVAVGRLFAAESMFHRQSDASKVALAGLVAILRSRGFALLDVQLMTPHLRSMGARAIPRAEYLQRVAAATGHRALARQVQAVGAS